MKTALPEVLILDTFNWMCSTGRIVKVGRAGFFVGNRLYKRALWLDPMAKKPYVVCNGVAYEVRVYDQEEDGLYEVRIPWLD